MAWYHYFYLKWLEYFEYLNSRSWFWDARWRWPWLRQQCVLFNPYSPNISHFTSVFISVLLALSVLTVTFSFFVVVVIFRSSHPAERINPNTCTLTVIISQLRNTAGAARLGWEIIMVAVQVFCFTRHAVNKCWLWLPSLKLLKLGRNAVMWNLCWESF